MRKLLIVVVFAVAALVGAFMAPQQAQAQEYPDCTTVTPFTQAANFMSIPGWMRWRYVAGGGRWISREEAIKVAQDKGCNVGPAPTGG
ncbi:MAG TPA: hypothetical protein VNA16_03450 [Abditibacteriaceae bacterium]|nr:hypothetical protein [Abditibacteriaceae bacterium]